MLPLSFGPVKQYHWNNKSIPVHGSWTHGVNAVKLAVHSNRTHVGLSLKARRVPKNSRRRINKRLPPKYSISKRFFAVPANARWNRRGSSNARGERDFSLRRERCTDRGAVVGSGVYRLAERSSDGWPRPVAYGRSVCIATMRHMTCVCTSLRCDAGKYSRRSGSPRYRPTDAK